MLALLLCLSTSLQVTQPETVEARLARLVRDLGAPSYPVREAASEAIFDDAELDLRLIEAALRDHGGSIAAVIDTLSIPRRTLNEKMAKYGLLRPGRAGPSGDEA